MINSRETTRETDVAPKGKGVPKLLSLIHILGYPGYEEKLQNVREKTGLDEAVVIGKAEIEGRDVYKRQSICR